MATEKTRMRRSASPPLRKSVKASLLVDVETHARWSAAASLRGMTNNAFALEALTVALKGLVIIDRRKSAGPANLSDEVDRVDTA